MKALRSALSRRTLSPNEENLEKQTTSREYTLSDFEPGTTLGTGTFGRVKLAKVLCSEEAATTYCALKILKKALIIRQKQVAHIRSEVCLLASIKHPFIVNMIAQFQDEEKLYMALEYVPGGELFTYLRSEGRFSNETAKFYAAQIVLAFGYLHSKKIAYRDLKPENLLITAQGNMKITDFGFAKVVEQRTWTLCGTPEYLAPEVVQGKGHGKAVDWWAFGVLIFEMLAGYPPFLHENHVGIYQKILNGFVEYPSNFDSKAVALLKKLLVADLSKRIGCLRGGVADVKKEAWFAKTNWKAVHDCTVPPPYVPTVTNESDTSNFDEYPESPEDEEYGLTEEEKKQLADFGGLGYLTKPKTPNTNPALTSKFADTVETTTPEISAPEPIATSCAVEAERPANEPKVKKLDLSAG